MLQGLKFPIVSRRAAYVSNPPGVKEQAAICLFDPHDGLAACAGTGLRKVPESTGNCALPFPFAVTSRRSRDARINQRIDSLPCPALLSMFPGRLARFLDGRDSTKPQRSACAGSNYVWIMRGLAEVGVEAEWDVVECAWD